MAPTETGIIDVLLNVARKRSQTAATHDAPKSGAADVPAKQVQRREAQTSDFSPVAALKIRYGLSPDSPENWHRLWQANPALSQAKGQLPIGWVQEADGEIVGYMGSIPLLYQYGDQTLLAVVATCYVADPPYRANSVGLVGSFFRQQHCDLFLNTTAGAPAGKIMMAFKAEPLPQKDYDTTLFWVLNSHEFLSAALQKMQIASGLSKFASWVGLPLLKGNIIFRRSWPKRTAERYSCRILKIEEIGDDFDDLWTRKVRERPRLLASRKSAILRWHFLIPQKRHETHIVTCYKEQRLAGYLILQTGLPGPFGLRKAVVADLIVVDGRSGVTAELFASAYELAKQEGSGVLEVLGFPEEIRQMCWSWKPFSRRYPAFPFYYKTNLTPLREQLTIGESWYATPFDGDTTLSP
jgi:hypothetical protein